MAYAISWAPEAMADLQCLDKGPRQVVLDAPGTYLADQPQVRTRRKKPMAPNPFGAPWALRLDEVEARVYYDIQEDTRVVLIVRVGRKVRNRVFIRGMETDMRELS